MFEIRSEAAILMIVFITAVSVALPINDPAGEITVDCADKVVYEHAKRTYPKFRCAFSSGASKTRSIRRCVPGQSVNSLNNDCESTDEFRSEVRGPYLSRDASECPEGEIYVPSIGICVENAAPILPIAKLESDNLILESPSPRQHKSKFQLPKDCGPDEIYNSELSLCLKNPNRLSRFPLPALNLVRNEKPLEIEAFSSISAAEDCTNDETYVPALSICVPSFAKMPSFESVNSIRSQSAPPLETANLIRDESVNSFTENQNSCKEGEIFVSEIGVCQPSKPSKNLKPIRPESDSLIRDPIRPVPAESKTHCPQGQTYLSELDICVPANPAEEHPNRPPSDSLIKESGPLEIVAFEDSDSSSDCLAGEIWIGELGICA